MKKFYTILCLTIASLTQLQAQAPQGFNYQATVRNASGDLVVNTNVYFKFNVIQGSQTAVPIFTETHYVPTDDLGQVNLVIGQGTANLGSFSALDWSLGSYYLGIELDTGNGYLAMGTTQLLSVPYALYAENSGNATSAIPNLEAVLAENNSANNQQIKDLQDPTDAQDAVTKAYVDTEVLNNVQNIEQVLTQGNDANGIQLKGIADPTDAQDAVTKAYFENNTTSSDLEPGSTAGDMLYWDGENWTQINAPENNGTLRFCDGQLTWGACKAEIRIFDIYDGYTIRYSIETNGSDVYDIRAYISQENLVPDENDTVILGWPDDQGYYMYKTQEELYLNPSLITNTNYYIRLRVESNLGISYSDVVQYSYTGLDVDNDGDGYTENQGDCDDNNYQVNPGASEICDGLDNNCDGVTDEEVLQLWFLDNDQDGYGGSISVEACSQPSGYVSQSGDCNDDNYYINPLAIEFNDGIDNNCNGEIDDGLGVITDNEGNSYDYITYGDKVWTVENAEMITYRDGTAIPQSTHSDIYSLTTGAWCYYNNDPIMPILYNWYAVAGIHDTDPNTPNKEFAPEGWHVPSVDEWTNLENYLIANGYNYDQTTTENKIAKSMASTTEWSSSNSIGSPGNDQSLNNSSGFNSYPYGGSNSSYLYYGTDAAFWSTSINDNYTNKAFIYNINFYNTGTIISNKEFSSAVSVRFVKD